MTSDRNRPVKASPPVEDDVRLSGWLANLPELATRPRLFAYLQEHKTVRAALFNTVNVMENIALIPDPAVACEALTLYWCHAKERFETHWKHRLAEDIHENHLLWAELHGTLKNVYANMRAKCGGRNHHLGPHDVRRVYD